MTENEEMGPKEVKNSQKKNCDFFLIFLIFDFFSFEIFLLQIYFKLKYGS